MKKITHSQFAAMLAEKKGAEMVGLLTLTDSKARKTGNPFGPVMKLARGVAFTGVNYEKNVNSLSLELGGTGGFVAKPRQWGEIAIPGKLVTHKGKNYLVTRSTPRIRKNNSKKVRFIRADSGEDIPYEQIKPFLPEKKASARQAEVGLTEGAAQVEERDISFDSILTIRFRGKTYKLISD